MKVGVLGNLNKIKSESVVENWVQLLQENGYQAYQISATDAIENMDVLIVLGGDGAILHAAVCAAQKGVKIVGVNYGTLGFLAEYEKTESDRVITLLKELENGTCRILKRSILQLEVGGKTYYALNEIALHRNQSLTVYKQSQLLRLEIHSHEGKYSIAGDGALICTPTGSTAYSLSAGGAILTPEVPVFMLTPICAFSMRARPIVLSDNEEFALRIVSGAGVVSVDGMSVQALPENATIFIKKAPFTADFPMSDNLDFFAKVRNKLDE